MSHKAAKIGITGVVLASAFGVLLYTSLAETAEYYKHVDEVLVSPEQWQGKRLQLHGYAKRVMGRPTTHNGLLDYQFDVESNGKTIRAHYTGIAPDTFKEDAEVVLKGTLAPNGEFYVSEDGIIAKCPSKYEPKSGAAE